MNPDLNHVLDPASGYGDCHGQSGCSLYTSSNAGSRGNNLPCTGCSLIRSNESFRRKDPVLLVTAMV